ncbi:MAG TPA: ArsI/CadI family heavy metal resistance metalloenzyme [Candidatus Binataceae bacterium]|nr:ArsI/CadI family heavy metal resistance metalloenzyme [Candidatus Binataceae bacterium]
MAARVHVHLSVADLEASREFYEKFLGVAPVKVKSDLVKFVPELAPINLALSPVRRDMGTSRALNHLGVEVESNDAVMRHLNRAKAAGIPVREQLNVTCCYANQSKFWVIDPDGVEWEIYHVNFDTVEKHGGGVEVTRSAPQPGATG